MIETTHVLLCQFSVMYCWLHIFYFYHVKWHKVETLHHQRESFLICIFVAGIVGGKGTS
jgi:hypothetical protein